MAGCRAEPLPLPDELQRYYPHQLDDSEGSIDESSLRALLSSEREYLLAEIHAQHPWDNYNGGNTRVVAEGPSGYAMMHIRLYMHEGNQAGGEKHLEIAARYSRIAMRRVNKYSNSVGPSFLYGTMGVMTVATILYHLRNKIAKRDALVERIKQTIPRFYSFDDCPDEMLYGRAGLLYSLLTINKYCGEELIPAETLAKIGDLIIESGSRMANSKYPLMWEWHGAKYLGGAHGTNGIMHMLLQLPSVLGNADTLRDIRELIEYQIGLVFESGNMPTRASKHARDELVQWCHGAPSWVLLLCDAYKVFGERRYLDEARRAGEAVWQRGLLCKGRGICHGITGNALCLLRLYQASGDAKYLRRAQLYALFEVAHRGDINRADAPLSFLNGFGASVMFYTELLHAAEAPTIPGWDI